MMEDKIKTIISEWWNYPQNGQISDGLVSELSEYVAQERSRAVREALDTLERNIGARPRIDLPSPLVDENGKVDYVLYRSAIDTYAGEIRQLREGLK